MADSKPMGRVERLNLKRKISNPVVLPKPKKGEKPKKFKTNPNPKY